MNTSPQSHSVLRNADKEIFSLIEGERIRQTEGLELIASENFAHREVRLIQGSVLAEKCGAGYIGDRHYTGSQFIDDIEGLALSRVKELFSAEHANVQPHSGSQANMAVYFSVCKPGDALVGMSLSHGGHLTHGSSVNFSGKLYRSFFYTLTREGSLDYDQVEQVVSKAKPKILIAGHSAWPGIPDFKAFQEIAERHSCYLLVDMAHFAGLVAGGVHPSPVGFADFISSTTHKTLRGPRGGFLLCKKELAGRLDEALFPAVQCSLFAHVIGAKAVAFHQALQPEFKVYAKKTVDNAKALARHLLNEGFSLVTGGTKNHLILIDLRERPISGKEAEQALERAGITVNKNTVPGETRSPQITSGIRIGTPAITTRGMEDMALIAKWIRQVVEHFKDEEKLHRIRLEVREFCRSFPLF